MKHITNIYLALAVIMVVTAPVHAGNYFDRPVETYRIEQTVPGTSLRDLRQPSTVIEVYSDGTERQYQTLPGTSLRDWRQPEVIIRRID